MNIFMGHFILENARRYNDPGDDIVPVGVSYDSRFGYWTDTINLKPMIRSMCLKGMMTKKEDRETGEDQKGE